MTRRWSAGTRGRDRREKSSKKIFRLILEFFSALFSSCSLFSFLFSKKKVNMKGNQIIYHRFRPYNSLFWLKELKGSSNKYQWNWLISWARSAEERWCSYRTAIHCTRPSRPATICIFIHYFVIYFRKYSSWITYFLLSDFIPGGLHKAWFRALRSIMNVLLESVLPVIFPGVLQLAGNCKEKKVQSVSQKGPNILRILRAQIRCWESLHHSSDSFHFLLRLLDRPTTIRLRLCILNCFWFPTPTR